MVATTFEAVRTVWAARAPWLIPVSASTSGTSQTTYLRDSILKDPSSVGVSTDSVNNMWIFRPDAAAAGDRKRRLGGNSGSALSVAEGDLYPTAAWTNAPTSEQWDLWAIDPQIGFNLLVQWMEQQWIPDYSPLSMFADSDMQTSGVTNYSVSGAGARTKVTTAADVHFGAQALFFDAGTASEILTAATARVVPGETYFASALVRVDGGGPVYFDIYDVTNSAVIDSSGRVSHSLERYMSMQRTFTTPASPACEEVALRVIVTGATDNVYVNGFSGPYKATDMGINAPSTLINDNRLRKLLYADYGVQHATGVYDADSRTFDEIPGDYYHLRAAHHHANPYRIEFRDGFSIDQRELWIEHLRRASDVVTLAWTAAGETSPTIPIEKRLIALDSLRRICKHVLATHTTDTAVRATLQEIEDPRGEYKSLMLDYQRTLETPQYRHLSGPRSLARL